MTTDAQTLTRKEKNLILAKRNYLQKKKEREDLEKKNEELTSHQISLLKEMSLLQSKLAMIKSILQDHEHTRTCNYQTTKDKCPKRKWNDSYHEEVRSQQFAKSRLRHDGKCHIPIQAW